METNFFKQVADLNITGTLQILIAKGEENNLIVSVLPQNEHCGDNAKNSIIPYNIKATPENMDKVFFERITKPMETASGVMDNMEAFLKQMEEAKRQSAMEKEKADKEKKDKEAKNKKYTEAMAKVDELDKAGKYKEAWTKLPDPSDFPEYAETIRKRRSELSAKLAPDLFAQPVAVAEQPQEIQEETEVQDDFFPDEAEDELDWGEDGETVY